MTDLQTESPAGSATMPSTTTASHQDGGNPYRRPATRPHASWLRGALILNASRVGLIVGVVAGWWALVELGIVDELLVSTPSDVWQFLRDAVPTNAFWTNVEATLLETLWGFLLGSATGILSGLLLARFEWLDRMTDPLFTFLNALPRIALAPLFILWFGIGPMSKVMLAASLVYFILLTATRAGVKSVDPTSRLAATLLGATPRQMVRTVIFPGAVPSIFGGLRLASVYALLGVIAAEMVASQNGLGKELTYYSGSFNTAGVIGILLVLGVIGALLNAVMAAIERRLLRWQGES